MKSKVLTILSVFIIFSMLFAACTTAEPAPQEPAAEEEEMEAGDEEEMEAEELEEEEVEEMEEEEAMEPRILRIRLYGDIQNLDPAFRISENDEVVSNAVMNGLVRYCPNSYDLCNQLAEEFEQSEDGLEIRFKLKEGVMFHNGYGELTAEDVKYSYERFIDPDVNADYADDWATLDYVEVIDKYNGVIHLTEPYAPLWNSTMPVNSGNIVSKKFVEEVGLEGFATNIIGTGPYMFQEWKPQEMVILTKNPDYFGPEPYWDEIHLIPIEDDKAGEVALEAGDIDFGLVSMAAIERFEDNPDFKVWSKPSLRYSWVGMNVQHPKLEDPNVRWAVIYGIDVDSIIQAAYLGKVERECALIPPGLTGYWEDAPCHKRDVEKAKEYLEKANVDSLELRLDIQDTSEDRIWGEIIQQNLADVGIDVEINPMDSSTFWTTTFGEQAVENNELHIGGYSMQNDPAWATMWFTCDQIGVWNAYSWCDEDYDALHKQAMITLDSEKRDDLYIEMQQRWDQAAHSKFVTHGVRVYGYSPAIDPATTPNGKPQVEFFQPAE